MTDLDRLIDDVARGITEREPPAHLRARVLARLDERRAARRAWLFAPVGVAAMAVVVTMLFVKQSGRGPATPVGAPAGSNARMTPATTDSSPSLAGQIAVATQTAAVAPRDRAAEEASAWREAAMPALPAIVALGIDAIQPDALAIPQLTVKPLVVAPIDADNDWR